MATAKRENESLDDFSFDSPEDFFGETKGKTASATETTLKNVMEDDDDEDDNDEVTILEEDETPKKVVKKKVEIKKGDEEEKEDKEEDDEEEDDFSDLEEDTTKVKKVKTEKSEEAKDDNDEDDTFNILAEELKEKGVLRNVEIPKDKKLTEEEFVDLQEKEIDARVAETFESMAEKMDDEEKAALKWMENGGKLRDFKSQVIDNSFNLPEFDEDNQKHIDRVINYYVSNYEDLDEEDREDRVKYIKDGGKAKESAKKWYAIIKKDEKEERDSLLKEQEDTVKTRLDNAAKFKKKVSDLLKTTETIGVFSISKKEQTELDDFINKPTVKTGKNKYAPALSVKLANTLRAETEEDLKRLIILAKLYKDDFDITDLVEDVTTKATTKVKKGIEANKKGFKAKSSGSTGVKKSLSEYF